MIVCLLKCCFFLWLIFCVCCHFSFLHYIFVVCHCFHVMYYWCCWCLLMVLFFVEFFLLCFIIVRQHLCIVLYWCSLAFPSCALLVFIDASLLCLLATPCCVLLMFTNISLLCSICVCQCFLLCSIDVYLRLFALFYWHLVVFSCYVLSILIDTSLLCFVGVIWIFKLIFPLYIFLYRCV